MLILWAILFYQLSYDLFIEFVVVKRILFFDSTRAIVLGFNFDTQNNIVFWHYVKMFFFMFFTFIGLAIKLIKRIVFIFHFDGYYTDHTYLISAMKYLFSS